MITTCILLGVALSCMLLTPRILGRGTWRIRHPELCLTLWYSSFGVGAACTLVGTVNAVVIGVRLRMAADLEGWVIPTVEWVGAWAVLTVAGGASCYVVGKVAVLVATERRIRTDFALLTAQAKERMRLLGGLTVHIVESQETLVCSLRRGPGEIIISRGVADSLDADSLSAVFAHERAHLRGLHDIATRLAAFNSACFPHGRAQRALSRDTHLLIELAADRAAARTVGRPSMIRALESLATVVTADAHTLRLRASLLSDP
ncbi:MAG: M56 family metallopeptidase [Propionibacteriales bacterium]|nr:M56 family metallopeptidase [Propionibacteriales bacterium]